MLFFSFQPEPEYGSLVEGVAGDWEPLSESLDAPSSSATPTTTTSSVTVLKMVQFVKSLLLLLLLLYLSRKIFTP